MEYDESVSVLMPVHNGERYLREAIESVLNQTYTIFEFIIILKMISQKHSQIYLRTFIIAVYYCLTNNFSSISRIR